MELRIGVIGAAGFIGRDHIRRLTDTIPNACVRAVSDLNEEKTQEVAKTCGARVYSDGFELIRDPEVDAVLVTSWDPTHAQFVRGAIAANKPVFCEKPLASTLEDCFQIIREEMAAGKHLIQVGYMRRFDPGYLEMKQILDSGVLGRPLLVHCKSRTPVTPPQHTTRMHATNVVVHEIDVLRWLLEDEFTQVQAFLGRPSCYAPEGLQDPQLMLLRTRQGVIVDVEVAVNAHFGYEIQCEVVCEKGTVTLPQPTRAMVCLDQQCSHGIMNDWSKRFVEAYQEELKLWVEACLQKKAFSGSSAWDGYVACAVAETLANSQDTGRMEKVELPSCPDFYRNPTSSCNNAKNEAVDA